ncbi:MAG: metalloregulator ArsR/SmtB family transcription factor [Reyranellaceae bacterium]
MNIMDVAGRAEEAAGFLKSIANPCRLALLCELSKGERTVGELEAVAGLRQSAVSQHLARLREARLVTSRRQARTVHYALADSAARRVIELLDDLYCRR